jgi:uncharacterized protein YcgI (DUF1989 family)
VTAVIVPLNEQQLELLDASVAAGEATGRPEVLALALRELADDVARRPHPRPTGRPWGWRDELASAPPPARELIAEHVLEPGTGKAFEVAAGSLLRVEQLDGDQCVDLNLFNLADYREYLHVGRTRTLHGIHPGAGDFLWSAPPRERAMAYLLADTVGANDTLFPRCSANLYESMFGFAEHTNCADIQAEAQREYGLTPDDVHDSFNLFMATRITDDLPEITRLSAKPGDHVEVLALMDLLAIPNICGNDIMSTSGFSLSPVLVRVLRATAEDLDAVPPLLAYDTQRTPAQFRQPAIRTERRLARDPAYVASFSRTPVRLVEVEVELDDAASSSLRTLLDDAGQGNPGVALRDVFLRWWVATHA